MRLPLAERGVTCGLTLDGSINQKGRPPGPLLAIALIAWLGRTVGRSIFL